MDDPLCRDCKTRHKLGAEFCPLYKEESKTIAKKILKEVMPHTDRANDSIPATGHDKTRPSPQSLPQGAKCPVCEARRLKQLEAQKRYREKKRG